MSLYGPEFLFYSPGKRQDIKILETGCGSGANLWMIAREGFNTYGVDLSEASLTLCEKMLEKYNTQAQLSVQNMSAMDFDFNTFDAVVDVFSSSCLNSKNGGVHSKCI
ncbi:MAG: class I SAM-dependent methyltransferase [Alphaproteobacteria bacterium]|nr:class I SAM-dependent methyltransferase [Alphaproteobacteria bacterium]